MSSYHRGTTKAKSAPRLQGDLLFQTPELPGVGAPADSRPALANQPETKVGPLPPSQGHWVGLQLFGKKPILNYYLGDRLGAKIPVSEFVTIEPSLQRVLKIGNISKGIYRLFVGSLFQHVHGEGVSLQNGNLLILPLNKPRVIVLGRDQVTELIDDNGDSIIDHYRNASDAFQQTLQTRDYATSLVVQPDGSFLVAKGGIHNEKSKFDDELSIHRGTILHLGADGTSARVLAEGLRLPCVGLRNDGAIFASDQQGNYVPPPLRSKGGLKALPPKANS